jgi:hypothetical protein
MIQEHKLVKGTIEEILQYTTSQPNYIQICDLKEQLDTIGLEKISMVSYAEKTQNVDGVNGVNIAMKTLYVHIINEVQQEENNKKFLELVSKNLRRTAKNII